VFDSFFFMCVLSASGSLVRSSLSLHDALPILILTTLGGDCKLVRLRTRKYGNGLHHFSSRRTGPFRRLRAQRRPARTRPSLGNGAGDTDILVIGGGFTGVGVALDAASRGLSVTLVERGDLASGTSGWSSKLAHGGLRYLARADVAIAWESAVERGRLMNTIAPHLIRPLPMIF